MVKLIPVKENEKEQFILDCQDAYTSGAQEIFSIQYTQITEDDGQVISRSALEDLFTDGIAYNIFDDGVKAGGVMVHVEDDIAALSIIFVAPGETNKGIGYAAWCELEEMFPKVEIWVATTQCFDKRNIHFFVNKCGFYVTEYFNRHHHDQEDPDFNSDEYVSLYDDYFRLMKWMV